MKFIYRKIITIVIIALLLSVIIDYCLVMLRDTEPLFIFKTDDNTKYSLLYKIVYEDDNKSFYLLNFKIKDKKIIKDIVFNDRSSEECPAEETIFWEDETNYYIFSCPKDYYVQIGQVEYSLKNALDNDLISIDDLKDNNIDFTIKAKN